MKRIDNSLLSKQRLYAIGLFVLLLIFVFRVCAQFIQLNFPVDWLPPFEVWHSGALFYTILLIFQIVIIFFCMTVIIRLTQGWTHAHRKIGLWGLWFGCFYFLTMLLRFSVGMVVPEHQWFGAKVPTFFHLVLASFVLLWGHFHYRYSKRQNNE